MEFRVFIVIMLVMSALAARAVFRTVRGPKARHAACGGCGYELAPNPAGLTRCPECGREFLDVGIKAPPRRTVRSPIALAVDL